MKTKIIFILISVLCFINLKAQEYVGLSMGPSYAYDIYYSLTDGITASPERTNWELAFSTNPYDNNIRINSGNAVILYEVSNDINEWEDITSLNSSDPSLDGRFLGTTNKEIPFVPFGAPSILASTK